MTFIIFTAAVIFSYFVGSISSSVIISKKISGKDIRSFGSGNAGATNMLRVHGKKAGILTLLCDALKGVLAVIIGIAAENLSRILIEKNGISIGGFEEIFLFNLRYITGVFAVIGHDFPVFFGFRGGKGVATSLGVMLTLNPQVGLIVACAAVLIMAVTRYVSLGSIIGGILYPVSVLVFMAGTKNINYVNFICALLLGIILIAKHHANIKRLLSGQENKLFKKKGEKS